MKNLERIGMLAREEAVIKNAIDSGLIKEPKTGDCKKKITSSKDYENLVLDLFKSGKATEEQWEEMAGCVLNESECGNCPKIDKVILSEDEYYSTYEEPEDVNW